MKNIRQRGLVAVSVFFVVAVPVQLAARPAEACGMIRIDLFRGRSNTQLVAIARKHFQKGESGLAVRAAREINRRSTATANERAQALAIIGWVSWERGQIEIARATLDEARKLDPKGAAIDEILTVAGDQKVSVALRKALST